MTKKGDSGRHLFKKSPHFELLASAAIIAVHALAWPRLRIASDALFLEGVTISVIGSIVACRPEHRGLRSLEQIGDEAGTHSQPSVKLGSFGGLFMRKNGYRLLLVGLILFGAAIVIGELFVRRAG